MTVKSKGIMTVVALLMSGIFAFLVHGSALYAPLFVLFYWAYQHIFLHLIKQMRLAKRREALRELLLQLKGGMKTQSTFYGALNNVKERLKIPTYQTITEEICRHLKYGQMLSELETPFSHLDEEEALWRLMVSADEGTPIHLGLDTVYQQLSSNIQYFEEVLAEAKGRYFEVIVMYVLSYGMFFFSRNSLVLPGYEWVVIIGSLVIHVGVLGSAFVIYQTLKGSC